PRLVNGNTARVPAGGLKTAGVAGTKWMAVAALSAACACAAMAFGASALPAYRVASNRQPSNATASTRTATITVLSLRPIWRLAYSGRAAGESAGAVRRTPSGVISYTHASTTATGNPIANTTTTRRTLQFGILKKGKTWVAICTSNQAAMA